MLKDILIVLLALAIMILLIFAGAFLYTFLVIFSDDINKDNK